jgi:LDH2 family malate/lactate/ureidoglycolate dehydrogenase
MAIDVGSFIESETFKKISGNICRELRSSKKAPGRDRIYTAGEKEYEMEKIRRKEGIPINRSIQQDISTMKKGLRLDQYIFEF